MLAASHNAVGKFLRDDISLGSKDAFVTGQRQGYALDPGYLQEVELQLEEVPHHATLDEHGVEVVDIRKFLQEAGVKHEGVDTSRQEDRLGVGKAMLNFLEHRFGRRVLHLADLSRVSGGAIYGEATVRNTSSATLRNAQHVIHIDKCWDAISRLVDAGGSERAIEATVTQHWPFVQDDFARFGLGARDYIRLVTAQRPGMVNLWVSLTPGKLVQHPVAVLMSNRSRRHSHASDPQNTESEASAMPIRIKEFNDSITVLHTSMASEAAAKWAFVPNMHFGQALLFYTDRTAHGAVQLKDIPDDATRVSAELRTLVLDQSLDGDAVQH